MGFESGSIAYRRFNVAGADVPHLPDDAILEKFAALAMAGRDETTSEIDYGWTGPGHVLDGDFSVGNTVYNDCIHVGFRVDTNRVPAALKKAYVALEEREAASKNPSGFASRAQKRQAKESAARQIEADLASGKYRRSKLTPVLWDVPAGIVYAPVGATASEQLIELFERTQGLTLMPVSSGSKAMGLLDVAGKRNQYEDIVPTRFATSDMQAEYPWTAKGEQAKNFLGNEFLMWLWYEAGTHGGEIAVDGKAITIMFSHTLALDCSFGISGKASLKLEVPTEMAEAYDGLRSGKVPRAARLTMASRGQLFTVGVAAETLAISALKLPEVEKADSARVLFEERITLLRDFNKDFDRLYATFLNVRGSTDWPERVVSMRTWLGAKTRSAA